MKGWIAFSAVQGEEMKIRASAITAVYPNATSETDRLAKRYEPTQSNLLVDGKFLTVFATEEEVFKAIEMATWPPLYMVDRSNNVTKIEE